MARAPPPERRPVFFLLRAMLICWYFLISNKMPCCFLSFLPSLVPCSILFRFQNAYRKQPPQGALGPEQFFPAFALSSLPVKNPITFPYSNRTRPSQALAQI